MQMTIVKTYFVAFLQIYDRLSSFFRFTTFNLKHTRYFSGLDHHVQLLLKRDSRQDVVFPQVLCRIFSCYKS